MKEHGKDEAPKPSLSEILPAEAVRREAERTILISKALERFWQRPVRAAELQTELSRIFRETRAPERLEEIAAALGGDGYRLAECLARPLLVERLARASYGDDERFGAGLGRPSFDEWLESVRPDLDLQLVTEPATWAEWAPPSAGVTDGVSGGDRWSPTAALPEATSGETAVWTGSEMIVWGGGGRDTGSRYDPATDTWTATAMIGAPAPRTHHTAVWTGAEMVVWGGCGQVSNFCEIATGGRYDPVADSWTPVAPSPILPRRRHTAVWTGTEMVVWGGCRTGSFGDNACEIELGAGGRYDPATDSWLPVSAAGEPSPRTRHTAVWTSSEMIVWGGFPGIGPTNTGGRYDPATDTWAPTATAGAPAPRSGHAAVWTGAEMIVWGGCDGSLCAGSVTRFGDGGRYDPMADAWQPVTTAGAPAARADHTAVWTGAEMIVWGGRGQDNLDHDTGGRYDPMADAWSPTSTVGAPSPRVDHRAVWTGTEMIVWGRLDPLGRKSGGRYDPESDSWVPTSVNDPRRPRGKHLAVWTGSEMLLWGGSVGGGLSGVGDSYDPATDSWTPMSDAGEPTNREHGSAAVWTGTEMIVWGGQIGTTLFATGGRYDPTTDSWQPTATVNAPPKRAYQAMVWTGTRMFVWGGISESSVTATGGLYDPASDSWTPTSLVGAPAARSYTPGVWTGSRVIIWGGWDGSQDIASGGAYDPFADSWTATATAGAPTPRHFHTALWAGSRLLIWGGTQGPLDDEIYLSSGGLYDPAGDAWTPTTLTGAPSGRIWHASVWTGQEMIVWGGCNGPSNCGTGLFTGARYDPASDQWVNMPLQSAPGARDSHTGVWTGKALIIWGGLADSYGSNTSTGGVYTPRLNALFADGFESGDLSAWTSTVP